MVFKDKTFCASPDCKGLCGRKMTAAETKELEAIKADTKARYGHEFAPVSYAYFCGLPKGKEVA